MINRFCRASEHDIPTEPANEEAMLRDEIHCWRSAALRIGEELASVGPDGYYDLPPNRWLVWALAAIRLLRERLEARERELAELKAFYYGDSSQALPSPPAAPEDEKK